MSNQFKTELIATDFNRMLDELAAIDARIEFEDVVRSEVTKVIGKSLSLTKAAAIATIKRRYDTKEFTTFGGKKYYLPNRYPDALWAQIDAFRRDRLLKRLQARGIAKQTWANMATKLGVAVTAPSYVLAANSYGRHFPEDVSGVSAGGGNEFGITIGNTSPLGQGAQMESALLNAMNGRTRYFERNMEHSAFATLASRAAKYPGIFTTPVPAAAD